MTGFHDGLEVERESFGRPSWRIRHGNHRSEDQTEPIARHPLQQAGFESVQRAARESRRIDRATGGEYRSAHLAAKLERPGSRRCRRPGDRYLRSAGRGSALPRPRTAGEAEADGEDATRTLCGSQRKSPKISMTPQLAAPV